MDLMKQLLLLSQKLAEFLETRPDNKEEKRDEYIAYMNQLLSARGQTIHQIKAKNLSIHGHEFENELKRLNTEIIDKLHKVKQEIREDLSNLNKSRESEQKYHNPYGAVSVMDGTYYDKRK